MSRPDASAYLWDLLQSGEPAVALKVICGRCKRSPGRVVRTPDGLMWLGYLRNALAVGVHGEDSYLPAWLDESPSMLGECRYFRPTGATQPGWPAAVNVLHRIPAERLAAEIRARRRSITL